LLLCLLAAEYLRVLNVWVRGLATLLEPFQNYVAVSERNRWHCKD
jgi:hypothetical protein